MRHIGGSLEPCCEKCDAAQNEHCCPHLHSGHGSDGAAGAGSARQLAEYIAESLWTESTTPFLYLCCLTDRDCMIHRAAIPPYHHGICHWAAAHVLAFLGALFGAWGALKYEAAQHARTRGQRLAPDWAVSCPQSASSHARRGPAA